MDLDVWRKAHELVLLIYKESNHLPKEELFGLTSQMKRSAVSVPANIAEGFKRNGLNDKIRFYNFAQSSLEELRYYLVLSEDLGYLQSGELLVKANEIGKMLEAYVSKIKERINIS